MAGIPRAGGPWPRCAGRGSGVVSTERAEKVTRRIRECETLPALPAAAQNVLQLAGRSRVGADDLVGAVADDAALTARVLRAVNSSIYGLSTTVASLPQAVALLGPHAVRALVLGFSLIAPLDGRRSQRFDRTRFWRRAVYAATAARVLAQSVLPGRVEDCFVAALLMDVGGARAGPGARRRLRRPSREGQDARGVARGGGAAARRHPRGRRGDARGPLAAAAAAGSGHGPSPRARRRAGFPRPQGDRGGAARRAVRGRVRGRGRGAGDCRCPPRSRAAVPDLRPRRRRDPP